MGIRCGAAMTNLAHSASLDSKERITPSNRGIKHLDQPAFRWTHLNADKLIYFKDVEHPASARTQDALERFQGIPGRSAEGDGPRCQERGGRTCRGPFDDGGCRSAAHPPAIALRQRCAGSLSNNFPRPSWSMALEPTRMRLRGDLPQSSFSADHDCALAVSVYSQSSFSTQCGCSSSMTRPCRCSASRRASSHRLSHSSMISPR